MASISLTAPASGYDIQVTNVMKSSISSSEFNACTLQGIIEMGQDNIVRLLCSKTSGSSGSVYFYCNFSICPIDYTT